MNATMPIFTFCATTRGAAVAAAAAVKATASLFTKLMMSRSSFGSNILTEALFPETPVTAALLFTNAQVFDGTGRPPFSAEVLVAGNRIETVGEATAPPARQRAPVV